MLRAENLTCHHAGHTVVDSLDFRISPGELVALVGPAHAGKTSVIEAFLGRITPTIGRLTVAGFDVAHDPESARAAVACVASRLSFPPTVTGLEHLRDACRRLGRRMPVDVLRASLVRGGLNPEWHDRRLAHYPPAQRRKLALATALLKNAPGLLLDDPTADLTAADVAALIESLRRIRKRGTTILLATRDLAFARRLATRVVLMEAGAVVEIIEPNSSRRVRQADSYLVELLA